MAKQSPAASGLSPSLVQNRVGRDIGQRWMKWRNCESVTCPPWGCFSITGTEVVISDIVFRGMTNDAGILNTEYDFVGSSISIGVGWNIAFNSGQAVPPGEIGFCTTDLPTWCLIDSNTGWGSTSDNNNFMAGIVTYIPGTGAWSLQDPYLNPGVPPDLELYPGFQLLTTLYLPELFEIWHDSPGGERLISFRLGFIGGLVTYLRGGSSEQPGVST